MANTYTQIYIQVVFAVQDRLGLIRPNHKQELEKYISGIVDGQGQKLLAISCMPDHTHVFFALNPSAAISNVVGNIKTGSCNFINRSRWVPGRFAWQEGYGAFSYARSQLASVIQYIEEQEKHHGQKTFREEYIAFLKKFQVAYDEKYLLMDVE